MSSLPVLMPINEPKRTLACADIAIGQIRALQLPATPKYYELWYVYATAQNPSLNKAVNDIKARNVTVGTSECDELYDIYISTSRFIDRTEQLGGQVIGEVDKILASIAAAARSTGTYSKNLAIFGQELNQVADVSSIRKIVAKLVAATDSAARDNKTLASRLSDSHKEVGLLQDSLDAVRKESMTDWLTSLANRKYFDEALEKATARAKKQCEALSFLMIDIDHFKRFNDSHGHLTGDAVLRLVAQSIKSSVKGRDITARYGGEEFAVVLPNTELGSAVTVANQIRQTVSGRELVQRETRAPLGRVTVSIGVATLNHDDYPQSLIERADNCLYAAKRSGRNRVMSETDPELRKSSAAKVA